MLARYYEGRQLEDLHEPDLRAFQLHLLANGLTPGTVNTYNSAFRFVYGVVLQRNLNYLMLPHQRVHHELPNIMDKNELVKFFAAIDNLRDKAIFKIIYGSGLRLSEASHLRVRDIDSKNMRLFIFQVSAARIDTLCSPGAALRCCGNIGMPNPVHDPLTCTYGRR